MIGINLSKFYNSSIPVEIGVQYEDEVRYVYFDLTPLISMYGEGTFKIFYRHGNSKAKQMMTTSRVLNAAKAVLTSSETLYSGDGEIELTFYPTATSGEIFDNYRLPRVKTYIAPSLSV